MIRRWLDKFRKKKPEEVAEPPPADYEDDYIGYTIIDEETGMLLSVLMVCGCGNPVTRAGTEEDRSFYCDHCDRPCYEEKPCEYCYAHFLFDAEAVKAEFTEGFEYPEEE